MSWSVQVPQGPQDEFTTRANEVKDARTDNQLDTDEKVAQYAAALDAAETLTGSGAFEGEVTGTLAGHVHQGEGSARSTISVTVTQAVNTAPAEAE